MEYKGEYEACSADQYCPLKNIRLKFFFSNYLCAHSLRDLTVIKFNQIKAIKIKCWKSIVRLTWTAYFYFENLVRLGEI